MKLLAIETSVTPGSISAFEVYDGEGAPPTHVDLPGDQRTARSLAPGLERLLNQIGWSTEQIDLVAVTTGPGSFTGLRIGVTAAKALAYAAGADCAPVSTLAVLASQVADSQASGWAVLDAQRRELFASRFEANRPVGETMLLPEEHWLADLRPGEVVVGPVLQRLSDRLPEGVVVAEEDCWSPRADTVARLAAESAQRISPFELLPDYHRLSAAEEKLQKK